MTYPKEYKVTVFKDRTEWQNLNGQLDRDGGPAVEYANGAKEWYKEGKRHRENGPAVEFTDGTKHWYKEGKIHRLDGPAVEYADGNKEYWIEDKQLTEAEFNQRNQACDGKEVIIDGKTYKLELVK